MVMADCEEPPHAHVSGGGGACKLWLQPVSIARTAGYSRREERTIVEIAREHQVLLLARWDEECRRHG
ncbi:MAG: DUF4160 domain-containing protein [Candidatus Limnocylindria bacterium]